MEGYLCTMESELYHAQFDREGTRGVRVEANERWGWRIYRYFGITLEQNKSLALSVRPRSPLALLFSPEFNSAKAKEPLNSPRS
jgi:hypothetical protein